MEYINQNYILLLVDASDKNTEPYKMLRARYDVWGAPNIIIVDQKTGNKLKVWQSELYDIPLDRVLEDFKNYTQQ